MRGSAAGGLALLGLAALAASTFLDGGANAQAQSKPPVFADFKSKLALDGYDPVAYFKTGKPERGNPRTRQAGTAPAGISPPPRTRPPSKRTRRRSLHSTAAIAPGQCRKATRPRAIPTPGASSMASSTSTITPRCRRTGRRTFPATSPRATKTGPTCLPSRAGPLPRGSHAGRFRASPLRAFDASG